MPSLLFPAPINTFFITVAFEELVSGSYSLGQDDVVAHSPLRFGFDARKNGPRSPELMGSVPSPASPTPHFSDSIKASTRIWWRSSFMESTSTTFRYLLPAALQLTVVFDQTTSSLPSKCDEI